MRGSSIQMAALPLNLMSNPNPLATRVEICGVAYCIYVREEPAVSST